MAKVHPYTALASVYDDVMDHVDYEEWAGFVLSLVDLHAPRFASCLELACGTGRLAQEILMQRDVTYLATDGSQAMVDVAQERLQGMGARVEVVDFLGPLPEGPFDVILLLYDGLNYLREEGQVIRLLESISRGLAPDGIAIFDQCTPANSINNADYFRDEGTSGSVRFVRRSSFDAENRLHTTEFDLHMPGGLLVETHVQRTWEKAEIDRLIQESGLVSARALDGFSLKPAHDGSERIHRVVHLP